MKIYYCDAEISGRPPEGIFAHCSVWAKDRDQGARRATAHLKLVYPGQDVRVTNALSYQHTDLRYWAEPRVNEPD
jgi:hypothetical protein